MDISNQNTIWLVTRHQGALDWLRTQVNIPGNRVREAPHLDALAVRRGDLVIGTLPVQLIAMVCARGARYLHIAFSIPEDKRGVELSAADLVLLDARLVEFQAQAAGHLRTAQSAAPHTTPISGPSTQETPR